MRLPIDALCLVSGTGQVDAGGYRGTVMQVEDVIIIVFLHLLMTIAQYLLIPLSSQIHTD